MKHFDVKIELNGSMTLVGHIFYDNALNAKFLYSKEYLQNKNSVPISISLPLQEESFTASQTRNFFEGLLPEGFTRKSVAKWMHVDETDYISLLYGLGQECLGAIQVTDDFVSSDSSYEKLQMEQVRELANEGATKSAQLVTKSHLSLTGASGKVGLYYDADNDQWYLPVGNAPSTHIVKQSHVRLNGIVTNEQLSLMTAAALNIDIPQSFIINTGYAQDKDILFATKRYDRIFEASCTNIDGIICPLRLHQEDFAQALGISAMDKYEKNYEGYLKAMFDLLRNHSTNPISDQLQLWKIIIFDFLIGNTDNHIKNFSILYGKSLHSLRLAPAYDIISTTVYEGSTRDMAFHIGGEYSIDRIKEKNFLYAAKEIGLGHKIAMKYFEEMCNSFENALNEAAYALKQSGFDKAAEIREKILFTGGISRIQ